MKWRNVSGRQLAIPAAVQAEPGVWTIPAFAADLGASVSSVARTVRSLRRRNLIRPIRLPRVNRRGAPADRWTTP